ncbi:unnamed protein product [Calicophoron daubneyi]|uniref:Uncharacterized protein n=1 Tax=Calicophoron daubneyi TaxID=300641 RepID=A0AAV2TH60_CALDB
MLLRYLFKLLFLFGVAVSDSVILGPSAGGIQFHLIIPLGAMLSSSVYVLAKQPEESKQSRLVRYKWCTWSEWTRCSPQNCYSGVLEISSPPEVTTPVEKVEESPVYCVEEPNNKTIRGVHMAIVQASDGSVTKRQHAMKQRYRSCYCHSISFWSMVGLFSRNKCIPGSKQFECIECLSNEKIYPTRDEGADLPLPFCKPSFQRPLYEILAAVAGAVIGVLFIAWLARMVVKSISGSHRTNDVRLNRHTPTDGRRNLVGVVEREGQRDGQPDDGAADPLRSTFRDSDLPPAYKDVVTLVPGVIFKGNNPASTGDQPPDEADLARFFHGLRKSSRPRPDPRATSPIGTDDQMASSSQNLEPPQPPETPPPPSYEDIVAATGHSVGSPTPEAECRIQFTAGGGGGGNNGNDNGGGGGANATAEIDMHLPLSGNSSDVTNHPSATPIRSSQLPSACLPHSIVQASAPPLTP